MTFLAFPHCFSNPHAPQLLTWEVISSTGRVAWSVSGIHTPGAWWPTLYPDICQLVIGLDTWDVPDQDNLTKIPGNSLNYWGVYGSHLDVGCWNTVRCFLHQTEFYVCPKDDRNNQQKWQCGGPESLYCKAWGCETTGSAWWKPSSSRDWVIVLRNFTPKGKNCRYALGPCGEAHYCIPLNISFTTRGRNISDVSTLSSWMRGRTWGLRYYVAGYDFGFWFTVRLKVQAPGPQSVGPNSVLREQSSLPPARQAFPRPPLPSASLSPNLASSAPNDSSPRTTGQRLFNLLTGAFLALNQTNPELTVSCWLCLASGPPYYEGLAVPRTWNGTTEANNCLLPLQSRLTLTEVWRQGTCVGNPLLSH